MTQTYIYIYIVITDKSYLFGARRLQAGIKIIRIYKRVQSVETARWKMYRFQRYSFSCFQQAIALANTRSLLISAKYKRPSSDDAFEACRREATAGRRYAKKGLVAIKVWRKQNFREKIVRQDNVYRGRALSTLCAGLLSLGRRCCRERNPLSSVACAQAVPQMTHAKVNYTLKGFNIMKRSICMRGRPAALPHHGASRFSACATDVSWVRWAQRSNVPTSRIMALARTPSYKKKRRV